MTLCALQCLRNEYTIQIFPAVLVNSGIPAFNLVKEALSDDVLLVVASELIINKVSILQEKQVRRALMFPLTLTSHVDW